MHDLDVLTPGSQNTCTGQRGGGGVCVQNELVKVIQEKKQWYESEELCSTDERSRTEGAETTCC